MENWALVLLLCGVGSFGMATYLMMGTTRRG
jgi:hypothetical protein